MSQQTKIGKTATKVFPYNGMTVVKYHQTDVVVFDQTRIILNSGGWLTATTKTRMNQAANQFGLGFTVFQSKGVWIVNLWKNGAPVVAHRFYDGMIIWRKENRIEKAA